MIFSIANSKTWSTLFPSATEVEASHNVPHYSATTVELFLDARINEIDVALMNRRNVLPFLIYTSVVTSIYYFVFQPLYYGLRYKSSHDNSVFTDEHRVYMVFSAISIPLAIALFQYLRAGFYSTTSLQQTYGDLSRVRAIFHRAMDYRSVVENRSSLSIIRVNSGNFFMDNSVYKVRLLVFGSRIYAFLCSRGPDALYLFDFSASNSFRKITARRLDVARADFVLLQRIAR